MVIKQLKELQKIVSELNKYYPQKKFTLDGRLVGDIGEVIAEELYQIKLYEKVIPDYDAITELDNKKVQIKTTLNNSIWYPRDKHPELLLVLEITESGELIELYNRETSPFIDYIKTRKRNESYNYYTITKGIISILNNKVKTESRILKRIPDDESK